MIRGGGGDDTLEGAEGSDLFVPGAGDDTIFWYEGDGYDRLDSTGDVNGGDVIYFEPETTFTGVDWRWDSDHVYVGVVYNYGFTEFASVGGNIRLDNFRHGNDSVLYFEADTNDNAFYSANGDTTRIYLTSGDTGMDQGDYTEIIVGSDLPEVMTGGGGYRDLLYGSLGDDTLIGNDNTISDLRGGGGNDTLLGGNNVDRLAGDQGDDYLDGGGGTSDLARYDRDNGSDGVFVNLSSTSQTYDFEGASETVAAGTAIDSHDDTDLLFNIEDVRGTNLDDVIVGSSVSNYLRGRGGDDTLVGGGGDDVLRGDGGGDTFVLALDGSDDTIQDYLLGQGDEIDLSSILDLTSAQVGALPGGAEGGLEDAGYVRITQGTGAETANAIVEVDQDGGGDNRVRVGTLENYTFSTESVSVLYSVDGTAQDESDLI